MLNDRLWLYYSSERKRPCKDHPSNKLVKSEGCPVEFAYLYPPEYENDGQRWVAGFVRTQHEESENLHKHNMHGASKVASSVLQ